jgi:hypothetical protein
VEWSRRGSDASSQSRSRLDLRLGPTRRIQASSANGGEPCPRISCSSHLRLRPRPETPRPPLFCRPLRAGGERPTDLPHVAAYGPYVVGRSDGQLLNDAGLGVSDAAVHDFKLRATLSAWPAVRSRKPPDWPMRAKMRLRYRSATCWSGSSRLMSATKSDWAGASWLGDFIEGGEP